MARKFNNSWNKECRNVSWWSLHNVASMIIACFFEAHDCLIDWNNVALMKYKVFFSKPEVIHEIFTSQMNELDWLSARKRIKRFNVTEGRTYVQHKCVFEINRLESSKTRMVAFDLSQIPAVHCMDKLITVLFRSDYWKFRVTWTSSYIWIYRGRCQNIVGDSIDLLISWISDAQ